MKEGQVECIPGRMMAPRLAGSNIQLLATMRARRLCRLALRCWMGLTIVLGLTSHTYSPARKCLRYSRILQVYSWLAMAATLGLYFPYWDYTRGYFEKGTFRRQGFVIQVSEGSVKFQLLSLTIQSILRVFHERKVCQVYNELSTVLRRDLGQGERSRFYYAVFLGKFHNYLQNFNFVLSILMIVDMRAIRVPDLLANFYFVYSSVARESPLFAYVLLLLDLGEALRLNRQQEPGSYGQLMVQLRRQERLLALERQVHSIFAWLVASAMLFHLYFNTATIYLGYAFVTQRPDSVGLRLWIVKLIFTVVSFLVKLSDSLLLQIVCQHLFQESRLCASPQVFDKDAKAAQRQWELSVLRRAIREASKENKVLGLFRLDMRCAFALISSSLSYGMIIMQMGYVHS